MSSAGAQALILLALTVAATSLAAILKLRTTLLRRIVVLTEDRALAWLELDRMHRVAGDVVYGCPTPADLEMVRWMERFDGDLERLWESQPLARDSAELRAVDLAHCIGLVRMGLLRHAGWMRYTVTAAGEKVNHE